MEWLRMESRLKLLAIVSSQRKRGNCYALAEAVFVYAAFVDAKKHSAFTGSKATCDARVGGEFTAWDGYISGKNLLLEEGERIVQEWITTEWPEGFPPSRLELTFTKVRGGTEILMVHSGVPAELADEIADGWNEFYWEPLKKYFEK
jgi:activator of HSP90 ATPase